MVSAQPLVDSVGIEPTTLGLQVEVAPLEHASPYSVTLQDQVVQVGRSNLPGLPSVVEEVNPTS